MADTAGRERSPVGDCSTGARNPRRRNLRNILIIKKKLILLMR
jgi:hypothetical protein